MRHAITTRPDALVLGVGGSLGIEWLRGVLAGITDETGVDFRACEYLVGTSAGSVVAAALAAGERPSLGSKPPPEELDDDLPAEPGEGRLGAIGRWTGALAAPFAPTVLRAGARGGALVRRTALKAGPRSQRRFDGVGRYVASLEARFDGRLRIVTVERASGRRVVFGAPGAPEAEVHEAVMASCAIPWVTAPIRIGESEYVDGGLWSPSNIDVVPARRGSHVLAFLPTAARGLPRSPIGAYRAVTVSAARTEALALRARGAHVRLIRPDAPSAAAMGQNLMDASRRADVLRTAYAQGRRLGRPAVI